VRDMPLTATSADSDGDEDNASQGCVVERCILRDVASPRIEEPDAGNLHVRICGGPGKATTRGYPTAHESLGGAP
jgi:hypothetical protein